jgi:hypothetical protein
VSFREDGWHGYPTAVGPARICEFLALPVFRRGPAVRAGFRRNVAVAGVIVQVVTDEQGKRRRVQLYRQSADSFDPWLPQPDYFRVLLRAYKRLGFDLARLASAVGWRRDRVRAQRGARSRRSCDGDQSGR